MRCYFFRFKWASQVFMLCYGVGCITTKYNKLFECKLTTLTVQTNRKSYGMESTATLELSNCIKLLSHLFIKKRGLNI